MSGDGLKFHGLGVFCWTLVAGCLAVPLRLDGFFTGVVWRLSVFIDVFVSAHQFIEELSEKAGTSRDFHDLRMAMETASKVGDGRCQLFPGGRIL